MNKLIDDFGFALRLLTKTPAFSLLCLTVVALGVAIALYTVTLTYEFTMRPPPFPDGERFAVVKLLNKETNQQRQPTANVFLRNQLVQNNQTFDALGVLATDFAIFTGGDTARQYYAGLIEPELLAMTEKAPALGRRMDAADALPGAAPVVLLGHDVWQNYFAGDPTIIGSQTRINGTLRTIIGVMPRNFQIGYPHQLWLPATVTASASVEQANDYQLIGSIKEGKTFADAQADIQKALANLANEYPQQFGDVYAKVDPIGLIDSTEAENQWLLPVIAVLIMLLTAINLSSMLFVRANTRRRELAVRSAVGAGRWEIVKQVLLESFLLCFAGTVIAIGLADLALRTIEFDSPINLMGQSWRELWIHPIELFVASGMMVAIWLVSGLATVLRILRHDVIVSLEGSQGSGTSRALNATTRIVVGVELVAAFFILIACGTLTAAIVDSYSHDYGVNSDNTVTARISLRGETYRDPASRRQFIQEVSAELSETSGLSTVSVASVPPGGFAPQSPVVIGDREFDPNERLPNHGLVSISTNYFDMMGVAIVEGRDFLKTDDAHSQPVAIVDKVFADRYWPNESPIGKRIQVGSGEDAVWRTIVGVNNRIVQSLPLESLRENPSIYLPLAQQPPANFHFALRTSRPPVVSDVAWQVREAVATVDRNVAVESVYTLDYRQRAALTSVGAAGKMLAFVSLAALALSIIGIYGVISRSVLLRSSEIGIRQAIGSSRGQVMTLFLKQGAMFLTVGTVIGGGLGILISTQFTNVSTNAINYIPGVSLAVLLCLGALVLLATYLPTKTLLYKEPGDALRYE